MTNARWRSLKRRTFRSARNESALIIDGGDLAAQDGLFLLVEHALDRLHAGDSLQVRTRNESALHDLPALCRVREHVYAACIAEADGAALHTIQCGPHDRLNLSGVLDWGVRAPLRASGEFDTRDWRVGAAAEIPAHADAHSGFAPRGARVEKGAPLFPFTLTERDQVWCDAAADLYEQATANQWDASRDIPWRDLPKLPDAIEEATVRAEHGLHRIGSDTDPCLAFLRRCGLPLRQ